MTGLPYIPAEIAHITGGKIRPAPAQEKHIRSIAFDSRQIYHADETLFAALISNHRDGHRFLEQAYEKGVRCFLVSDEKTLSALPSHTKNSQNQEIEDLDWTAIIVPDVLTALQDWARHHRSRFQCKVIAITGSNGKTIVKEWLASVLDHQFQIIKSPKSYNSQLGVPLSVLQISPGTEIALIEAGISEVGEMERLQKIIKPDWGILTHFGDAHAEGFETEDQKLDEKLKLFSEVKELWVGSENEKVLQFIRNRKLPFASLSPENAKATPTGWEFSITTPESEKIHFQLPVSGPSALENALLTILSARKSGMDWKVIQKAVSQLRPVSMRQEMITDNPELTILSDAYNSDIASIRQAFSALEGKLPHSGRVLILSDLEHLGQAQKSAQKTILEEAIDRFGAENIILIGPVFEALTKEVELNSSPGLAESLAQLTAFPSTDALIRAFSYERFKGNTVLLKGARKFELEKLIPYLSRRVNATFFRVNLNHLSHNYRFFRRLIPPQVKTMAMVKAFSYGSGSWEIARALEQEGVDYLAVAYISEGIQLREKGIKLPIMVMNPDETGIEQLFYFDLEPEVFAFSFLEKYLSAGRLLGLREMKIHLKVDTGMHRLGFSESDTTGLREILKQNQEIRVVSIFSHLAVADDPERDDLTLVQFHRFKTFTEALTMGWDYQPMGHILNTAGALRFTQFAGDMVRLGIGLYGVSPLTHSKSGFGLLEKGTESLSAEGGPENTGLREIGSLHTVISQLRYLAAGEAIGYGASQITKRPTLIATLPVGYADGIPRRLGNGVVSFLVKGKRVPTFGRICMDMLMVDITGIPGVEVGDEVIVFGASAGTFQSVNVLAQAAGTIAYEILAGISPRVRRIYAHE